ncbi:MAG: hypothetical protein Q7T54_00475 [Candidatus Levybacteria bacterium]|nr:hypothetical protein [Candidatus Levybacteria bacterium]
MYTGVIIQESLTDQEILDKVHVIRTVVEEVTLRHNTPWVKSWILHTIEIEEDEIDKWAEWLSHNIDDSHDHPWYADFRNDKYHYVIFPDKIFKIDRSNSEQNKEAQEYGKSVGIPDHQLDWEL